MPLDDPSLSPINASMHALAPVHVVIGTRDVFVPDIRRLCRAFTDAGVDVTSIEKRGATHTYPQRITTPEARWAISSQASWLRQVIE